MDNTITCTILFVLSFRGRYDRRGINASGYQLILYLTVLCTPQGCLLAPVLSTLQCCPPISSSLSLARFVVRSVWQVLWILWHGHTTFISVYSLSLVDLHEAPMRLWLWWGVKSGHTVCMFETFLVRRYYL